MYIVGLGNPGDKYTKQRHNVGWMVLDGLVDVFGLPAPVTSGKYSGRISEGAIVGQEVTLLYPDTYMNNSGTAVRKLVPNGEEGNIILIYDDVDIPIGEFKLSVGRGDGGHNGVKSVIGSLGTKDFIWLRVGIAATGFFGGAKRPTGEKLPRHVLGDFKKREQTAVDEVALKMKEVIEMIVSEGIDKAMNEYN